MISYQNLALLVLFIIAAGLGIYLFIIFHHLLSILKDIRSLLTNNMTNLDQTLDKLPSIINSIDEAAINLKEGVEKTTEAVDAIGYTVSETVSNVSAGTRQAAEYVKIISDIVAAIIRMFERKS